MKSANFSMRTSLNLSIFLLLIIALPQSLAQPAQASKALLPSTPGQGLNREPGGEGETPAPAPGLGQALGQTTTPLQSVLNPDGTLNLNSGFRGSLDARGWQMVSDAGVPPRFVRSDTGASSPDSLTEPATGIPGDENWDGTFGTPNVSNKVEAVAVNSSTGDVYVGGTFTTAGGSTANHIAKWNRDGWSALSGGMNGTVVYAIAVNSSTGDVYAGGDFTTAGGVTANRIAKWNGSAWSALGSGMNDIVAAIALSGTGDVYAGGTFTTAGGVTANRIAKWNSSAWSALGSGMNNTVFAIAVNSGTGDVYAGGTLHDRGWGECQLHSQVERQRVVCPRQRRERYGRYCRCFSS